MTSPWPHDDNASLLAFYGDPQQRAWATQNLVPFVPPWQMSYKDDAGKVSPVSHFIVHRKIHDPLARIFNNLMTQCQTQGMVERYGLHWYGGCYAPRTVRGSSSKLSTHYFAAGLDLDPEHEPMNRTHTQQWPAFVVSAFKAEGAFWGGDFISRQDPMHFQFAHE